MGLFYAPKGAPGAAHLKDKETQNMNIKPINHAPNQPTAGLPDEIIHSSAGFDHDRFGADGAPKLCQFDL